jgi:hypothetical protein
MIQWLGVPGAHGVDSVARALLAVGLTLVLAGVSYRWIEQPILAGGRVVPQRTGVRSRRLRPVAVLSAVPLVMLFVAGASLAATNVPPPLAGQPVIMLVGDSVPLYLEPTFEQEAASRGWRVVSAAQGACPVSGENPTGAGGVTLHEAKQCPSVVVANQDATISADHPSVVLWWDRWSVSDYVTASGRHVTAGTPEFWRLRADMLRATVHRLGSQGAEVVFVATEPPGTGILTDCDPRCPRWTRFMLDHYEDITVRWNAMMRTYAREHPRQAGFISVTDAICHTDTAPCDDTIDGVPARPDGTHYQGDAKTLVVSAILQHLSRTLAPR